MRAVSNTSPLSNLAIIGRLELLRERYGTVLSPPAVHQELAALSHADGKARIETALREGWLKVEPLPADAAAIALPCELDPGETDALRLCLHLRADKVILDDALGRTAARSLGLQFSGLLGELVFAKLGGRVGTVKAEIDLLRTEARFFVSAEVEAVILAQAGE
jgi:predicted nucleic acid-binding protein